MPFDVPCGANIWEAGEILEMRVFMSEAWARSMIGIATRVVVFGVARDSDPTGGKD